MITKSEFLNKVHGSIFPLLKKYEVERISALKKWGVGMTLLSFALMVIIVKSIGFDKENEYLLIFFVFISLVPAYIGYTKLDNFSCDLKEKFMAPLLGILNLKKDEEGGGIYWRTPEEQDFNKLEKETIDIRKKYALWTQDNLFPKMISMFFYNDCFSDEKCGWSISEIKLEQYQGKNTKTIFKGPVVEFNSDIKMNGKILIFAKLGIFSDKKVKIQKNLKYSEFSTGDVVFDKEFTAYTKNEIEAKTVLNKIFLRQVLRLKEIYPKAIFNLLVENGKITISINTDKNMFEFFSITHSLVKDKFFEKFYDEIEMIYKVRELFQ